MSNIHTRLYSIQEVASCLRVTRHTHRAGAPAAPSPASFWVKVIKVTRCSEVKVTRRTPGRVTWEVRRPVRSQS